MKYAPAVIYHLLPVIPLAFGLYYLTVATVMLVALAYIKVHKLKIMEAENEKRKLKPDPTISKALEFWERLTFLKRTKSIEE